MMPILKVPTPLRSYTSGHAEISVAGRTVGEALGDLLRQYPTLKPHLYDGEEKLRPFVNLFVGQDNIQDLQGLATPLTEDARMLLIPSIAGGFSRNPCSPA
jgi:molybdopterin synthase sulfur carrier subunit